MERLKPAKNSRERVQLQSLATQLQKAVQILSESETYQTISQLTDWASYFAEKREQLAQQLEPSAV